MKKKIIIASALLTALTGSGVLAQNNYVTHEQLNGFVNKIGDLSNKVTGFEGKLNKETGAKALATEAKDKAAEAKSSADEALRKANNMSRNWSDASQNATTAKADAAEAKSKAEQALGKANNMEQTLATASNDAAVAKGKVEKLESKVTQEQQKIATVIQTVGNLSTQVRNLDQIKENSNQALAKATQMEQTLNQASQDATAAKATAEEAKKKIDKASEAAAGATTMATSALNKANMSEQAVNDIKGRINDYETVKANADKVAGLEEKINKEAGAKDLATTANTTAQEAKQKALDTLGLIVTSQAKMDGNAQNIEELKTKVQTNTEKLTELEANVTTALQGSGTATADIADLKEKVKDYDTVKENAKKGADLANQVSENKQKIGNLETKLEHYEDVERKADSAYTKSIQNAKKLEDYDTVKDNASKALEKATQAEQKVSEAVAEAKKSADASAASAEAAKKSAEAAKASEMKAGEAAGKAETAATKAEDAANKAADAVTTSKAAIAKATETETALTKEVADRMAADTVINENMTKLSQQMMAADKMLEGKINALSKSTDQGLAKVTALAGLRPLAYDSHAKWNISMATGRYKSENAVAFGAFYQPSRDVLVSFGTTLTGEERAYNAGISLRLGQAGDSMKQSEPMISASEFYDIIGKLQEEIAMQRQEIEALRNK